MSWTQPCCADCFVRNNPGRAPVRVAGDNLEQCCYCGTDTTIGIYVRADPTTVLYPRKDDPE